MQMLMAVDSAFNKLDRTTSVVRQGIRRELDVQERLTVAPAGTGRRNVVAPDRVQSIIQFGLPSLELFQPDLVATLNAEADRLKILSTNRATSVSSYPPNPKLVQTAIESFIRLEKAIREVERATRRIVTDAQFGLGPPKGAGDSLGPKGAGDALGPKGAGDALGPKGAGDALGPKGAGDALGPKGAGDALGPKGAGDTLGLLTFSEQQPWEIPLIDLFAQIGVVMLRLEQAATDVESVTATVLTDPSYGAGLDEKGRAKAAAAQIEQVFRAFEEGSNVARRTLQRVLAHPVYGLGPGLDLGAAERLEFAEMGGLNRSRLRLL